MFSTEQRQGSSHEQAAAPQTSPRPGLAGQGIYTYRQGGAKPWLLNNQLLFSAHEESQDFSKHPTPKMRLQIG